MQNHTILLDSNAGAPLHPRVRSALFAFLEKDFARYGNPSSIHAFGRRARDLLQEARAGVFASLSADPSAWDLSFTSGGTEANQWAIRAILEEEGRRYQAAERKTRPLWWLTRVEHSSVLDLVPEMQAKGVEVRFLDVTNEGEARVPEGFETEPGDLVSILAVNNETGWIQSFLSSPNTPNQTSHILRAISHLKSRPQVHIDYIAGWGKVDCDLSALGCVDLVSVAPHKLGGLSGVGMLLHKKSLRLHPLFPGSQEQGKRGGTENLLGILSVHALTQHWREVREETQGLQSLRDRFEDELLRILPEVRITGKERGERETLCLRVPHLSHFVFPGLNRGLSLVQLLDAQGFAVSSGSACTSQTPQPSHVLLAMGFSEFDALNSIRLSLHPQNTWKDLEGFLAALKRLSQRFLTPSARSLASS